MIRAALFVLALGACRNDAITYAHLVDPSAVCAAVDTYKLESKADVAICRTKVDVVLCTARSISDPPHCTKIADAIAPTAEVP